MKKEKLLLIDQKLITRRSPQRRRAVSRQLTCAIVRPITSGKNEIFEIELPSEVKFLDPVLSFLIERTVSFGIIALRDSNTFIALDEALSNAIKHGNRNDASKIVFVRAEFSAEAARFTIRDEGDGFKPEEIPNPLDPVNLYKNSGRGVMLIRHFMDEVSYNERGNEVTMLKRREGAETDNTEFNKTETQPR